MQSTWFACFDRGWGFPDGTTYSGIGKPAVNAARCTVLYATRSVECRMFDGSFSLTSKSNKHRRFSLSILSTRPATSLHPPHRHRTPLRYTSTMLPCMLARQAPRAIALRAAIVRRTTPGLPAVRLYAQAAPANRQSVKPPIPLFGLDGTYASALVRSRTLLFAILLSNGNN